MPGVGGGGKSAPTNIVAASIRMPAVIGRGRNADPHSHDGQAPRFETIMAPAPAGTPADVAHPSEISLMPKQMSTGDRTILGRITKRGNRYLRMLFIQGARVILLRQANWPKHSFGLWLTTAVQRPHHNVLAIALANKLARIAWTVLAQGRSYEARVTGNGIR